MFDYGLQTTDYSKKLSQHRYYPSDTEFIEGEESLFIILK